MTKDAGKNRFIILTDPCCDLSARQCHEWDIECVAQPISDGEKEILIDLNWSDFTPKEFYDKMRSGTRFMTSLVPSQTFCEHFRRAAAAGHDVLYLSTSTGLSGCFGSASTAIETVSKEYPGRKFIAVDTLRGSLGQGLLVISAAKRRKDGFSIEEIADWVTENRLHVHQVGSVDDLKYLKRAGRVTGFSALMGSIFNIKPIIIANSRGENESVSRVRGRKTSIKECLGYVKQHILHPEKQTVYVVNSDCVQDAEDIKKSLLSDIGCKAVIIGTVGPVTGASIGPGMFGIYFFGDEVTV